MLHAVSLTKARPSGKESEVSRLRRAAFAKTTARQGLRRAKEGREQRAEVRSNDSIAILIYSRLFRVALRYPRG